MGVGGEDASRSTGGGPTGVDRETIREGDTERKRVIFGGKAVRSTLIKTAN